MDGLGRPEGFTPNYHQPHKGLEIKKKKKTIIKYIGLCDESWAFFLYRGKRSGTSTTALAMLVCPL